MEGSKEGKERGEGVELKESKWRERRVELEECKWRGCGRKGKWTWRKVSGWGMKGSFSFEF